MAALSSNQQVEKPVPQPGYIFRGHNTQIHAVEFQNNNTRLLTGDAEGWVVLWNVPIKRAVAVWKAHDRTILGIASWGVDKVITHGRDNKLKAWKLDFENAVGQSRLSTVLPVDDSFSKRTEPHLLHSLDVNALNFCAFALCIDDRPVTSLSLASGQQHNIAAPNGPNDNILLAVPGVRDGMINIISLPDEHRHATILPPPAKPSSTNSTESSIEGNGSGMVMALGLSIYKQRLQVVAGYENGEAILWHQDGKSQRWHAIYRSKPHSQPVLSLDIAIARGVWFTSSADAFIARHPLNPYGEFKEQAVSTKHSGQQSLKIRSDGKIFATAGWDGKARVYGVENMEELAVLKWHKEGCYAVAFANVKETEKEESRDAVETYRRSLTVAQQREQKTKYTHWIAVGSKDGKVSLWDIY